MELKDELAATNDKLLATMEELEATKNEQLATKDGLEATKEELADAKEELQAIKEATKDELAHTKKDLTNLTMTMTTKDELKMLEKKVTILRDSPYLHICGSHYDKLSFYYSRTITFSKLFYSATNTEGGGLDISSGVFTAPWGGSYTVTWSTSSVSYIGHGNNIYLYKNSNMVEESKHWSYNSNDLYVYEQGNNYYYYNNHYILPIIGGRTLTLYLARGDTLHLYCEDCNDIYYTTFCVSLSTFDV